MAINVGSGARLVASGSSHAKGTELSKTPKVSHIYSLGNFCQAYTGYGMDKLATANKRDKMNTPVMRLFLTTTAVDGSGYASMYLKVTTCSNGA